MAGGARSGDDDDLITDINITPLVDVVLVLLIIMMVTATTIVSKTIPMELPEAQTGDQLALPTTVSVSIDASGQLYLDREPLSIEELRARVREARDANEDLRAIIAADGRIEHASVVRVIDLLRQERVTKFAINVRPSDLEQP